MKILIINTYKKTGGAAIAATRLAEALNRAGEEARMIVLEGESDNKDVFVIGNRWSKKLKFIAERLVIWTSNLFSRKNLFTVSIANTGFDITRLSQFKEADVIHLHWVNQGLLSLDGIKKIQQAGKPIVWTMHDMWPCTGICHHAHTCDAYTAGCGNCPQLRFPCKHDLSSRVFTQKSNIFAGAKINFVAVSSWLADKAKESTLLKDKPVCVIPNTLSLTHFKMLDKEECRRALNLPEKKKIILFGAARIDEPIKGFEILLNAIKHLIENKIFKQDELHLVTFGRFKHPELVIDKIPVTHSDIGFVSGGDTLSQLYSAADTTVSASLYETFGQTLIEAQACGCVPVSFGNSGQRDIITHKANGFLADYLSVTSLAEGIRWALTEGCYNLDKESLRNNVTKRYSGEVVAQQYIDLYKSLL